MSAHSELKKDTLTKRNGRWTKQPNMDRLTDADLAAAAIHAIEILTTVPHESLKVSARNGWLRLEGSVNSGHQRVILEDVTRHLPGVQGLIDSISINAVVE